MRKPALVLSTLLILFMFAQPSKTQDKIEIFGGYSNVQAPVAGPGPLTPCVMGVCPPQFVFSGANANGWDATLDYKPNRWLGVAADFGGYYRSAFNNSIHLQTYLFGPQLSLPGRISPFGHVLFGVAHQTVGDPGATAFASAIGGGVDVKLNRFASVRVIQLDVLLTRFGGLTQAGPRFSAGLVLRF